MKSVLPAVLFLGSTTATLTIMVLVAAAVQETSHLQHNNNTRQPNYRAVMKVDYSGIRQSDRDEGDMGSGTTGNSAVRQDYTTSPLVDTPRHDEESKDDAADHHRSAKVSSDALGRARRLIYVSHFFSQFSECAWQFAVVLFLAAIAEYQSILLVSSYSLTTYVTLMLLGSRVGNFIDQTDRIHAARFCILIENLSVLLATTFCCWILSRKEHRVSSNSSSSHGEATDANQGSHEAIPQDVLSIVLLAGIHIFGSLAMLLDQGFVMAIERDWIVVLSQQVDCNDDATDAEDWLSGTTVVLRQIYLSCKVLSPSFAGWIVGQASTSLSHTFAKTDKDENDIPTAAGARTVTNFCDLHGAAVLVGILCILSLILEYLCTAHVYHLVPALALPQAKPTSDARPCENREEVGDEIQQDGWQDEPTDQSNDSNNNYSFGRGLVVFLKEDIVWAGLSYSCLGLNSFTFGGAMTTFVLWKGMSIEEVGLWRGIMSAVGLLGTLVYQLSTRYTNVVNTGEWSIVYLFVCLTVACSSFWVEDYTLSIYLLVVSTAVSRIGLWVFDISVTLLYQEHVPQGVRGLVGGTQQSLMSFFTMTAGCLGLLFHRPEQFWVIATTGYASIGVAALLYTAGIFCRGQHFFDKIRSDEEPTK